MSVQIQREGSDVRRQEAEEGKQNEEGKRCERTPR